MLDFKIHKLQWSLSKKIKFFELPYPLPLQISFWMLKKFAPGEDQTHGLQIMRLTRCLLRYQG